MSSDILKCAVGRLLALFVSFLVGCDSQDGDSADAARDVGRDECGYLEGGVWTDCPEHESCIFSLDTGISTCVCWQSYVRVEPGICETSFVAGSQIVSDSATGLEWTRHAQTGTYLSADLYCGDLNLEERDDWRIPNLEELSTIVPESREQFNTAVFPSITEPLWTSEVSTFGDDTRWCFDTEENSDLCFGGPMAISQYLCVRSGAPP